MSFTDHAPEVLELAHVANATGPHVARQAANACPFQKRDRCPLRPVCPLKTICPPKEQA